MAAVLTAPNQHIGLSSSTTATTAATAMDSKSAVKPEVNATTDSPVVVTKKSKLIVIAAASKVALHPHRRHPSMLSIQQVANASTESKSKTSSPAQNKTSLAGSQKTSQTEESKTTEPLAPPPRPAQTSNTDTPDYFSSVHNPGGEFNPFEQSFGVPSAETPGGTRLPPVAALTSPAIPGANNSSAYNFPGSLRAGPLSPAMLEGPQNDYFGNISSRGFPTPNESSLRTGLTPGGGGSMFPAPSPNSQALFNQLASGGATPGTLDFHRTAMNAAARSKNTRFAGTSGAENQPGTAAMDNQHDATDAANGLFMLAKGGQANQFAVPNAPSQPQMQTRGQDQKRNKGSIGSGSGDGNDVDSVEDAKPSTRGAKGKKNTKVETTNGRRKSEATQKGSNKKAKGNNGLANVDPALEDMDDDDDLDDDSDGDDMGLKGDHKDTKKMTDEEKRRNFLERNRVAALKCRQRKKQWLANLQAKVEMYSAENDSLNGQVAQLHDEIRSLRQLLMGHKDCPVGHAQGIGQFLNGMQDPNAFANQHVNHYGMGIQNGAGMQAGMQRS